MEPTLMGLTAVDIASMTDLSLEDAEAAVEAFGGDLEARHDTVQSILTPGARR